MDLATEYEIEADAIADLFTATVTACEGAEEGALVGGVFFTRLACEGDPRTVFMTAPVAVATGHQGKGIGQRLIARGL